MKNRVKMCILLSVMTSLILVGALRYKAKAEEQELIIHRAEPLSEKIYKIFNYTKKEEPEVVEEQDNELVYLGEFLLTGYCDCPICQEEWIGTTALGVAPTAEWTIAVDPDIIPLGSLVEINGHIYCAEDVGGMINEYHIDIFCNSHEECYSEFCNGYAEVYLVK